MERRRMGEQERLIHYLHRFGGLIAVTVLHVRGPVTPERVRAALDHLQQRHALLRAHVRYRRLGLRRRLPFVVVEPEFVTEGTLPIPLGTGTGDWQDAARREMRRSLPGGRRPRARALLFPADADGISRILVTLDHTIADAQAAALMARDIMSHLAEPGLAAEAQGLPPALEARYRKPDAGPRPYVPAVRLPNRRVRGATRTTDSVWRHLTREETEAIRAAARAHGATMHATITAAMLTAAAARYGLEAMTALSTVEFRRLCVPPLPRETFGCFIDIVRTPHRVDAPFWTVARDVAFKLVHALAKDQEQSSILTLPGAAVYRHEMLPMLSSGFRLDALAVTTTGETGLRRAYGAFVLEDITMAVAMQVVGPSLFAVGYEREGALTLGVCHATHAISAAEVSAILDAAVARLRDLPT